MKQDGEKMAKGEIVRMILLVLGGAGVLAVGCVCPNLLQLVPKHYRRRYSEPRIKQAILRLDKRGWIIARQTQEGWKIRVTAKGHAEALAYELGQKKIQKPRCWDQKWRLLIFDIPESRRVVRDKIRRLLQSFNFYRLQDSVWVYPYECQEILNVLCTKYRVRSEALYIRAEFLDQDYWLRKHFDLKI
ncbi:CRISPR-associated endonuclease Cas2 [Candidatus Uhrbacteria bacterium]|nr:CRISPR-associated endonuclease Cas2 [Candidatus Uhrbacteria bacterium]